MAEALGYADVGAVNALLTGLERQGAIIREVRGRRTFRIALTRAAAPSGRRPRGSAEGGAGQPSAAIRRFEDELTHPRGMLRASILLLLDERPGHGYDLLERLKPLGFVREDPSGVYRSLRWLQGAGFVRPNWETPAAGPARRVFELTPEGEHAVRLAASALLERSRVVEEYLARPGLTTTRGRPKRKRLFEVQVHARLSVHALDEASARRKVERALARGRMLEPDVSAAELSSVSDVVAADADV